MRRNQGRSTKDKRSTTHGSGDFFFFFCALGWVRLEWRHTVPEIATGDMSGQGFIRILPLKEVFDEWEGILEQR